MRLAAPLRLLCPEFLRRILALGLSFLCFASARAKELPPFANVDEQLVHIAGLTEDELAGFDVAYLNLLCAQGLNGSEGMDIPACLRTLDEIAGFVGANTQANLHMYRRNPAEYANSEGQFRALFMVSLAVKHYGISYNPARIETPDNLSPNEVFFHDSKDAFIHGLLREQPRMGTCASLPVFWTALGRRVGYPLSLSNTLLHFFTRWDGFGGRFNFEGSQNGCAISDDAHYREFPVKLDDARIQYLGLLESFSRKREFMHFLITRGACLAANGRQAEATHAYELAAKCYPSNYSQTALRLYHKTLPPHHENQ